MVTLIKPGGGRSLAVKKSLYVIDPHFQTWNRHLKLESHLCNEDVEGTTLPMTSLRLSLSLSMTVMMMVVSLSTWAGTSKGKDSLKTGFRQRFIVTVFFFSTRLSLCISHTFTYGSATRTQAERSSLHESRGWRCPCKVIFGVRFAITLLIVKVREGSKEADTELELKVNLSPELGNIQMRKYLWK